MPHARSLARASAIATVVLLALGATPALASPPTLTLAAPSAEGWVATSHPDLQGTTSDLLDPINVSVYAGPLATGTPVCSIAAVVGASGEWSANCEEALPDGQYTAVAEQSELGEAAVAGPQSFVIDTVAPSVSLQALPTYTNDAAPTLQGTAGTEAGDLPAVLVRIYAGTGTGGTPLLEETVTPVGGSWSYVPAALADGTYTVQALQRDEAGNEGHSQVDTFTVDTLAPAVTLEAPSPYTNDATPTLHGSAGAEPGDLASVTVRIYKGEGTAGELQVEKTVTPTGGSWSYTPAALADGTYTVQALQRDQAGNEGHSQADTFILDTVAPTVTLQPPPAYTDKPAVALAGQLGQATGDVQSVTVTVYKGPSLSGTVAAKGTAAVSGASWTYTTPSLAAGTYTVQASQHDQAGNVGVSAHPTFTVDLTAPVVTVQSPAQDAQLKVARPTISGTAGTAAGDMPDVKVAIYGSPMQKGEKPLYEVELTANEKGDWSTGSSGPELANGIYTLIAEQEDQSGNVGKSEQVTFSVSGTPLVALFGEGLVRREGMSVSGPEPTFSGQGSTLADDGADVTLKLYEGDSPTGSPLRTLTTPLSGSSWSTGLGAPLADGTYTVQAEQEGPLGQPGFSSPVPFTVDADAPVVTLRTPANGATVGDAGIEASGQAGQAPGDDQQVTVSVYSGASAGASPVETATGTVSGGAWTARLGALTPGTYTARAEQDDDVGNVGTSTPSTFTVAAPSAAPPPTASFNWFPAEPHVGEAVSLVSTSTDPTSAIIGYAWNLTGSGGLSPGAQTASTSFATPGAHSVSLQVTDALGATGTTTESIQVAAQPLVLMQPFPVVRIAGSEGTRNVTIRLLTVQAPVGASVTIVCRGRGCPTKRLDTVAPARKSGVASGPVLLTIHRFERRLPVGVVLEIRVGKAGEIGKYTKFVTRRGKLPVRTDSCLGPTGNPMECPST
jgi:hypothetical protein